MIEFLKNLNVSKLVKERYGIIALITLLIVFFAMNYLGDVPYYMKIIVFVLILLLFFYICRCFFIKDSFTEQKNSVTTEKIKPEEKNKNRDKEPLKISKKVPQSYLNWIHDICKYIDLQEMQEKGEAISISLPEIFINLYANEPWKKFEGGQEVHEQKAVRDIESIIAENKYVLIKGKAGCGKTTLLRHLAYKLSCGDKVKAFDSSIPVLIYLRECKDFLARETSNHISIKKLLASYFHDTEEYNDDEKIIDTGLIQEWVKEDKVLFLLDGIDEIEKRDRDRIADAFALCRNKHPGNIVVISGRPHGIEGVTLERFGDRLIEVLDFNLEQVTEFINKWFMQVYSKSEVIGKTNANSMLKDIESHPGVRDFMNNPLMLTAICILYNDKKELPNQRAELYKKFIDHLIYCKFDNPEEVIEFLKTLSFNMHKKGLKGAPRNFAVDQLKKVIEKNDNENDSDYNKKIECVFDDLEPRCGLLKIENGRHEFWHLTFQEYLTALYIVSKSTQYNEAIKDYWDDEDYGEVIKLFIGYLGIEMMQWASQIIEEKIDKKQENLKHVLLAADSLNDIYNCRRKAPETVKKTKDRLISIIKEEIAPEYLFKAGEILGWLGDPRDLKEFVNIEAGEYELAWESGETKKIVIPQNLSVGKYPVVNSWYEEFVAAGGYKNRDFWTDEGKKWLENTGSVYPRYWNDRKWRCPNAPVVGVCWYEAVAFCNWLTKESENGHTYRLLTEMEWQAAAAGREKREYPWEGGWDKTKCNNGELKIEKTSSVGIFNTGKTPETGIYDLAGNVWEWMTSNYRTGKSTNDFPFDEEVLEFYRKEKYLDAIELYDKKGYPLPVLRGGSWLGGSTDCRCTSRYFNPYDRNYGVGFRCARI